MDFSEDQLPAFHQPQVGQADADLDCCCIHCSSDSLKPNSIQITVFSQFCVNTIYILCKQDMTLWLGIIPNRRLLNK